MSVTYELSAPIEAHDETRNELTLRRPTIQETRAIKSLPYRIDKNEEAVIDTEVVAKYIAVCAGIPPSSVNQLDLHDLNQIGWIIVSFFMKPASPKSKA